MRHMSTHGLHDLISRRCATGTRSDDAEAARGVELLNTGGFRVRKSLSSLDDENEPNWVPRSQLYVGARHEFAFLAGSPVCKNRRS
jgi:hypothetical protein